MTYLLLAVIVALLTYIAFFTPERRQQREIRRVQKLFNTPRPDPEQFETSDPRNESDPGEPVLYRGKLVGRGVAMLIHKVEQEAADGRAQLMKSGTDFRDLQMLKHPAKIAEYKDYDENAPITCPACTWSGTPKEGGSIEYHNDLFDVSCPVCDKMLLVVQYPSVTA